MSSLPRQQIQMTFSIKTCKCVLFELTPFGKKNTDRIPDDKFVFNFSFKFGLDESTKLATIEVGSTLANVNTPDEILANLNAVNEFLIVNFNESIVRNPDGQLAMPDPILASLLSLVVSSLRGMYAVKLDGSLYANAIIPLIDTNTLLPKRPMSTLG